VKKAVKQLGGEIKMRSTYQKGSVFYFALPVGNS
jgi:chemotaxis protein histidine kinase CheA